VGNVTRTGEMINISTISVGKCEGTRSLGRARSRWEDNIRMIKVKLSLCLTKHHASKAY
jgi:hypothetical protein